MIKYLQKALKPKITQKEYLSLDDKSFFKEIPSKHFECNLCPEHCSPEIYLLNDECFINCDADVLQSPYKIDKREAVHYVFSLDKFTQEVISKNSLKPILQKEVDDKAFTIGEKVINGILYKTVYLLDITDRRGKVKNIATQRMRELSTSQSRLIVITPDNFINDNAEETRLHCERVEVLRLDDLIENNFCIKSIFEFNQKNIDSLKNQFELVVISREESFLQGQKLKLSNEPFKVLLYFAKNSNIPLPRDICISNIWSADYPNGDKMLADNIAFIRSAIKKITTENYIEAKNKQITFKLDKTKIYTI